MSDAEIGPEMVDEALHPSPVGRGVVQQQQQLDGVALPLEPKPGAERPFAGGQGSARPSDGGSPLAHIQILVLPTADGTNPSTREGSPEMASWRRRCANGMAGPRLRALCVLR